MEEFKMKVQTFLAIIVILLLAFITCDMEVGVDVTSRDKIPTVYQSYYDMIISNLNKVKDKVKNTELNFTEVQRKDKVLKASLSWLKENRIGDQTPKLPEMSWVSDGKIKECLIIVYWRQRGYKPVSHEAKNPAGGEIAGREYLDLFSDWWEGRIGKLVAEGNTLWFRLQLGESEEGLSYMIYTYNLSSVIFAGMNEIFNYNRFKNCTDEPLMAAFSLHLMRKFATENPNEVLTQEEQTNILETVSQYWEGYKYWAGKNLLDYLFELDGYDDWQYRYIITEHFTKYFLNVYSDYETNNNYDIEWLSFMYSIQPAQERELYYEIVLGNFAHYFSWGYVEKIVDEALRLNYDDIFRVIKIYQNRAPDPKPYDYNIDEAIFDVNINLKNFLN